MSRRNRILLTAALFAVIGAWFGYRIGAKNETSTLGTIVAMTLWIVVSGLMGALAGWLKHPWRR